MSIDPHVKSRLRECRRSQEFGEEDSPFVDDGKVILQGEVLFRSGSDELSEAGLLTVQKIAAPLGALLDGEPDQMVLFGGHTDDVPIANERFSL